MTASETVSPGPRDDSLRTLSGWRRAWLSFFSFAAVVCCCAFGFALDGPSPDPLLKKLLAWLAILGLFATPGWLLSLPAVFLIRRIDRFWFWLALAAGSCIGPAVMGATHLWAVIVRNPDNDLGANFGFDLIATGISISTTLLYLYLLRRTQTGPIPHDR
jgi:hypothetical protein